MIFTTEAQRAQRNFFLFAGRYRQIKDCQPCGQISADFEVTFMAFKIAIRSYRRYEFFYPIGISRLDKKITTLCPLCLVCLKLEKIIILSGVRGYPPPAYSNTKTKSFLLSVKPIIIAEEKGCVLGSEPVAEFLPSARFKSGINLVHDTVQ